MSGREGGRGRVSFCRKWFSVVAWVAPVFVMVQSLRRGGGRWDATADLTELVVGRDKSIGPLQFLVL